MTSSNTEATGGPAGSSVTAGNGYLADGAIALARRGYHVFPCRPRRKDPATPNGFLDAVRDERQIERWWDEDHAANIGIACGASGVVVLDIDSKHGADPREVVGELDLEHHPHLVWTGEAPEPDAKHPNSLAGVRGIHLYFRGEYPTAKTRIAGVEIRGAGSYVLGPPSGHPSGVPYEGDPPSVDELLEAEGWSVEIADAQKVKGLAPLAVKTDQIDSKVLATLSQRDLVPAIWLPDPEVREERELARFRLHLVKHRSMLKQRIHSTLINFGAPARSPISSGSRAASCSPASISPSPGWATSRPRSP